ncbi:MAG: polysaccharide biosynthesis tyrosine autokinase [Isosphaeraceae bacterium]
MNPETQQRGDLTRTVNDPTVPALASPSVRTAPATRLAPADRLASQPAAVTPMALLRAFRRRSGLALGIAILFSAIAATATWFLAPMNFKAHAKLHIAAQAPKILFTTVDNNQDHGGDFYKRYQSTQQTLVKSHLVLAAALLDPKVARYKMIEDLVDPIDWLQQKLGVDFVSGSEVMEISLTGPDPDEVAGLVNAVKKAYMDEVVNVDLKRRTERFDYLKKMREHYTELLKKKRETMRRLAESVGSNDRETLALRQQYALEHLQFLQKERLEIQSQRRRLEVEMKQARPEAIPEPASISEAELNRLVDQHPAVAELIAELAERELQLQTQMANLRRVARHAVTDPAIQALQFTVKDLRGRVERSRRKVRPEVRRQAEQQVVIDQETEGDDIRQDLAMLADLEQRLDNEIKSISIVNRSLTTNTLDLQANQEEVAQMEVAATKIAQEVEALAVELEAPPRIRLIDDATVPRTNDTKKRYMMVGMVTLGSFFAGLLGVAFLELQTRKVDTADEVPVELGLTVMGALPILPARGYRMGALARLEDEKDRYWRHLLLESVDATRTMLVHAARSGSYRAVMITSATPGEGKTSLASYMATSLAESGMRTLLIDADLRRPMMHKLFDLPQEPGLSEVLRSEVALDGALAATAVPELMLLTAGRCDRQSLRALSQGGVALLFDELKQRFDFILVDTSPILPVADAMLIAQHVDAALFSIFRDVSSKLKVKVAYERLQQLGVPVLGAVVTGAHGGAYGNNYYDPDSLFATVVPESVAVPPQPVN